MSPRIEALASAAKKAAASLLSDFGRLEDVIVSEKGPSDFVSSADLRSQAILREELARSFADHVFVLEEGEAEEARPGLPRLFVDPLDGTTNFLHGLAHFAVSVGLQVDERVVAGVVLCPVSGELFWAEKGNGAWLECQGLSRRLRVSSVQQLARAVVGTGIPDRSRKGHEAYAAALVGVMREVAGVRRFGSAALDLCYVASGRFEAFFERGLAPWDVAAGSLLVEEAGGRVSKSDGTPMMLDSADVLASAGGPLHDAMIGKLAPLRYGASF